MRIMIPLLVISHTKQSLGRFLAEKNKKEKSIMIMLSPQASEYSIDQIREINRETQVHQPIKKLYILEDFDRSSLEAQNAFLKLLEEPPVNIEFILVVHTPYLLLPTIISRTKIIRLEKRIHDRVESHISKTLQTFLSKKKLSALDFSMFTVTSKDDAQKILIQLCFYFRERFLRDSLATKIVQEILLTERLIQNNNLNPQLALDHLLIFIAKNYSMK